MTGSRWNKVFSVVKGMVVMGGLLTALGAGAEPAATTTPATSSTFSCPAGEKKALLDGTLQCIPTSSESYSSCSESLKNVETAETDMKKACSEGGISTAKCIETVKKCAVGAEDESLDGSGLEQLLGSNYGSQFGSLISAAGGLFGSKQDNQCPNEGAVDYFEEKDRIQRDIKDLESENSDLEKEIAEEEEQMNEQMKDAQDQIAQAQKELSEKKLDLNQQARDTLKSKTDQQQELSKQLRDLNKANLDKRAEMTQRELMHLDQMNTMTKELGELECLVQVKALRDELVKKGIYTQSEGRSALGAMNDKREKLQSAWNSCIEKFSAKRIQIASAHQSQMISLQQELRNIQESIEETNQSLTSVNTSTQQALADIETGKSEAEKAVLQEMQNAQTALQNAQTTMQKKQQAIRLKQASLQQQRAELSNRLSKLGPEPKRGTKHGWREAESATREFLDRGASFVIMCCNSNVKDSSGNPAFEKNRICTHTDVIKSINDNKELRNALKESRKPPAGSATKSTGSQ